MFRLYLFETSVILITSHRIINTIIQIPNTGSGGDLRTQPRAPQEDQEIKEGQEEVEASGLQRQLRRLRGGGPRARRRQGDLQAQEEEEKVSWKFQIIYQETK